MEPMTTTQWARENGTEYRFSCALDNHEPTRNYHVGTAWKYGRVDENRGPGIVLADVDGMKDAERAVYLVDDGRTVEPYYVAAWKREEGGSALVHIICHPFPTDVGEDGEPITRKDDGRPVSFAFWQLGPSRAYHLKVSRVEG